MKYITFGLCVLLTSPSFGQADPAAVPFLNRCAIAMSPARFAPLFLDRGRILQHLIRTKGNPVNMTQAREPNPYMSGTLIVRSTYTYRDISFTTGYVAEIPKEILTGVHVQEPGTFGPPWLAKGISEAELHRHLGKPRKLQMGNQLLTLYDFAECSGFGFSGVGGTIELKLDNAKLSSFEIRYSY